MVTNEVHAGKDFATASPSRMDVKKSLWKQQQHYIAFLRTQLGLWTLYLLILETLFFMCYFDENIQAESIGASVIEFQLCTKNNQCFNVIKTVCNRQIRYIPISFLETRIPGSFS
jgi:hypothetical protein